MQSDLSPADDPSNSGPGQSVDLPAPNPDPPVATSDYYSDSAREETSQTVLDNPQIAQDSLSSAPPQMTMPVTSLSSVPPQMTMPVTSLSSVPPQIAIPVTSLPMKEDSTSSDQTQTSASVKTKDSEVHLHFQFGRAVVCTCTMYVLVSLPSSGVLEYTCTLYVYGSYISCVS